MSNEYDVEVTPGVAITLIVETPGSDTSEWAGVVPGVVEVVEPVQIPMVVEVQVPGFPGPPGVGSGGADSTVYETRFAEVSPSEIYRAEAAPGTLEDVAEWRIQRISIGYNGDQINTTTQYPDGSTSFAFRWDQRSVLTYT